MSKKNSAYYVKQAEHHGLVIKEGGGHTKIYGPAGRGMMTIPRHRELSSGVERSIRKWFLELGIVVAFALGVLALIGGL